MSSTTLFLLQEEEEKEKEKERKETKKFEEVGSLCSAVHTD
jgi:hypothetical protein